MASDADVAISEPLPLAYLLSKKLKMETNTKMPPSTAAPISIPKAAPSTATADAAGSSDVASSSSSFSDYHSTLSNPAATALLAQFSSRHPPRQRTDSFSSGVADDSFQDRNPRAPEGHLSTDCASVSSTPNRRRFRQAGPALLKPRPASIATTASNFDFDGLQNEDGSTPSNTSLIAQSSSDTDHLENSPSRGKARATLHPQGSPQVSELHLSAINRAHPYKDHKATEELRKLQVSAASTAAASKRPSSGSPRTLPQLPKEALQLAAKHDSKAQPSHVHELSAGHSDALVQQDYLRHAEDDDLLHLLENQQTHQYAPHQANTHNQHHLLRTFDGAQGSKTTGNTQYRLRRRRAYRTLSSKRSQASLSISEDDWDGRTSSSSLEDRLSNLTYTTTQSASQLWKTRDDPAQPRSDSEDVKASDVERYASPRHQMTAWEKQIHDDSEKIKAASESIFGRANQAEEANEDRLNLMISVQIQLPGMSAVGKLLTNRKSLFSSPARRIQSRSQQMFSAESSRKPSRRRPDLLQHQHARKELLLTSLALSRRNIAVKLMVFGVLLGSWIGRSIGLL